MFSEILHSDYVYAFAVGSFGSTFFMIVDLQSKVDNSALSELRDMWTFRMILLRCMFGIGAATIVYVAFQAELLGEFWHTNESTFSVISASRLASSELEKSSTYSMPNTSLIVVLSFLSGYAQTFAPKLATRIFDSYRS